MTAGATEPVMASEGGMGDGDDDVASGWAAPPACVITADGTYGARLTSDGESWYPERWTLDGPEPYAVPLPAHQPEEPGTEVLPLTDGRVLIHRVADGRHTFSLLYPTGPGTGELPLGAVECPDPGTRLRLLPPAPDGERAYALAVGRGSTAVWLVAGGAFGPEHLAEVPGHCSGGVWLDSAGRLLALDRFHGGRTKTVVVDLGRGGEVSPLLQIAERSNDRLLLADADSGLLLIRSDAPSPGRERLGWGVLGSTLPVRFPECLTATGCSITPFAIQPGQVLTPEACAVALRIDGPGGTWVGMWRPSERRIDHRPAPEGWLAGTGLWTREGVLHLPYASGGVPCGVARLQVSTDAREPDRGDPTPSERPAPRPVPLQQASLNGRLTTSRNPVVGAGPVVRTSSAHPARHADVTRRPPGADAGPAIPATDVRQNAAAPEPRHAETPGAGAETPIAGTPGAGTPGAGTPGAGVPAAEASPTGPHLHAAPVEVVEAVESQRAPAPHINAAAGPFEPERPVPSGAPEPAEPRRPRPGLWTKVAATPPPGRSLGAGFIAALPREVEVRPAVVTGGGAELPPEQPNSGGGQPPLERSPFGGSELPSAQPEFGAPAQLPGSQQLPEAPQYADSPQLPGSQQLADAEQYSDSPQLPDAQRYADSPQLPEAGQYAGSPQLPGSQQLADAEQYSDSPQLPDAQRYADSPQLLEAGQYADSPQLPGSQQLADAEQYSDSPQLPEAGRYVDAQQYPVSTQLPPHQQPLASAPLPDHRQLPGSARLAGAPEFTGFTKIADSPGPGSFTDFTEFRGETPLRSFASEDLPPEQPWGTAPPAHPQAPAHHTERGPENPESVDRTAAPDRPEHQDVPARRTPSTHRRPLHAGPPMPGEGVLPAAVGPDGAVAGDPVTAAAGGGEETGGEDEETSPSATRTMTAR
ncbi:hypothetical protein [Streptomyces sp. NPDC005385]|uniref:hypothetical protein n=1 Tax=Streptomyces sp. NPDC005385 TaxID=3157039 RepID=UPI0033B62DB3